HAGRGCRASQRRAAESRLSRAMNMVTDIHCHFIPDRLFKFVQAHAEFDARVTAADSERIDLTVRGMHYGLNATFFQPAPPVARMEKLGLDRAAIFLATPPANHYP